MRLVKWIAIAMGVCLVVAAGGFFYVWRQATALPDWYTQAPQAMSQPPADVTPEDGWIPIAETEPAEVPAPPSLASDPAPPAASPKRPKADRHELRGFHRRARGPNTGAVVDSRAIYERGKLTAGVVLDLSRIDSETLAPRDRTLLDRAIKGYPGLSKRNVYIGIEDRPVNEDGVLQLGGDPQLRVGNLEYPLAKAAAKLGMSPAELRGALDQQLEHLRITDPDPG